MKQRATLFLQAVIILFGLLVLVLLIRFPMLEGRAANLDLFSIYADPFILYGYAASTAFFVALFQVFRLLGYIRQHRAFSSGSVQAVQRVKQCALVLAGLIVLAGLYIRLFHHKDDDPAGFLAMCIVFTFGSVVVATAAGVVEGILQQGLDLQNGEPQNSQR
jgi:cytochrome bd-type quinol oxidase subunit 2